MIIRLNGADFSENNIGTIRLARELTSDTKELLSKYTKSLTEDQKYAVQDFIEGLKEKGIWQYLGNFYLPILANNLEEAMINVKTLKNDYDNPDSTYYKLGEKGGLTTTNVTVNIPTANRITVKLNASQLNHHVMVYPLKAFDTSGKEGLFWFSKVNAQRGISLEQYRWLTNSSDGNGNIFNSSQPVVSADGNRLIGLDFLTDKPYTINGTVKDSQNTTGYAAGIVDNTYTDEPVHVLTNYNVRAKNEYGLISLGTGIPVELLDAYGELSKSFFDIMTRYK